MRKSNQPTRQIVIGFACVLLWIGPRLGANETVESAIARCQSLIEHNDREAAGRELETALRSFPQEPTLHNLKGVLEALSGRYESAEAAFRKAIELAPRFTGAYVNLGRLYQENPTRPGAVDRALATYQQLLRFEPHSAEGHYQSAVLLGAQQSYRDALAHLDRLPAEMAKRAQVLSLRCAVLAGLRETERAGQIAAELAESADLSEVDVVSILPSLQVAGANEIALLLLESMHRRGLASPKSKHRLALAYEHAERFQAARQTLEQAVADLGVSTSLLIDLARIAFKEGDREGTLGYLGHARDLDPENADIHYFFGIVCVELNLSLDAKESLQKAVELDPDNPYHNYAYGAVLMGSDAGAAIPYLKEFCDRQPANPHGHFTLGVAYYQTKQFERARKEMTSVLSHPETLAGAHYYLGRMALQDGEPVEAIGHLEQAVAASPEDSDAWAELGLARLRAKDFENARQSLERAVALDPSGILANMNLYRLYRLTGDPRTAEQQRRFDQLNQERSRLERGLLRRVVLKPF